MTTALGIFLTLLFVALGAITWGMLADLVDTQRKVQELWRWKQYIEQQEAKAAFMKQIGKV